MTKCKKRMNNNCSIIDMHDGSDIPSQEWLFKCPKIELHAHLHGSVRKTTLADLYSKQLSAESNSDPQQKIRFILKNHKTFNEVFALFDVIHNVVCSKAVLQRIVNEVLVDFAKENVQYLELRSTPRQLQVSQHSRAEYVQILVTEIENFPLKYPQYAYMQIRLLLTVNNSKPLSEAEETLDIIQHYMDMDLQSVSTDVVGNNNNKSPNLNPTENENKNGHKNIIVGIDFAPKDIKHRQFACFEQLFIRARKMGLKITMHFAEYLNVENQAQILQFRPERLGHAIYLTAANIQELIAHPIPIEMCPTSNLFCKSIASYAEHPFKLLRQKYREEQINNGKNNGNGNCDCYPMLFCTDDCGVFETNLTHEWLQMCVAHHINKTQVRSILLNAVSFIFTDENTKRLLRKQMQTEFGKM